MPYGTVVGCMGMPSPHEPDWCITLRFRGEQDIAVAVSGITNWLHDTCCITCCISRVYRYSVPPGSVQVGAGRCWSVRCRQVWVAIEVQRTGTSYKHSGHQACQMPPCLRNPALAWRARGNIRHVAAARPGSHQVRVAAAPSPVTRRLCLSQPGGLYFACVFLHPDRRKSCLPPMVAAVCPIADGDHWEGCNAMVLTRQWLQ